MDHLLILWRDGIIIFQKFRINQNRCQVIVELMGDVARHHAKRLNPLVMPDFIVLLGQHLHALIDLL